MKGWNSTLNVSKKGLKKSGFKNRGKPMKRGRKPLRSNPDLHDWPAMAESIFSRSGGRCERCRATIIRKVDITKANVHHILPRSKGGTDDPINLALVCSPIQFYGGPDYSCHTAIHANPIRSRKEGWLK